MEQKNQFHRKDISTLQHKEESNECQNDIIALFQVRTSNTEIYCDSFYLIQKIEMFLLTIISSLAFFKNIENDSRFKNIFKNILSQFYIIPSLFNNILIYSHFVIGFIFIFIIFMVGLTLSLVKKFQQQSSIDQKIIKLWMILVHLFLPIPGHIIGYYYGYFFSQLTHEVYLDQLVLLTFTGLLWSWTIVTCNILYNSEANKRKSDICKVNHNYLFFHNCVLIFPMIQAMMPSIISTLFPTIDSIFYFFQIFIISISISIYLSHIKIYHQSSMNKFVRFLFLMRITVSFIWVIDRYFPEYFTLYSSFVILLAIVSLFTEIKAGRDIIVISTHRESNQQTEPFDPTINLPFPFRCASFTKQDIALYAFVFSSVIFMVLLNAVAAQRVPIAYPLPDVIHNRFMVSKCIRIKITKAISQISNDFILLQIFLLFFLLFVFPQYFDFRRSVLIYGFICIIRAISFLLTSLPIPCTGEPNCPCADRANIKALQRGNPLKIAMSWLFGLGMFLKYPECGDLIISGHTICIWLFTRTICNSFNYALERPFNWLVSGFMYTFSFFAMGYIILSKNHYSIDVWFGFIITECFWNIYNAFLKLSLLPPKQDDPFYIRLIRWVETRPPKRVVIINEKLKDEIL